MAARRSSAGIESLLSQDFADLEFVVADNASDDGKSSWFKTTRVDPRVRINVRAGVHRLRVGDLAAMRGRLTGRAEER